MQMFESFYPFLKVWCKTGGGNQSNREYQINGIHYWLFTPCVLILCIRIKCDILDLQLSTNVPVVITVKDEL